MKKTHVFMQLCAATVFLQTSAFAAATNEGWYAGLSVGMSINEFESEDTSKIIVPGSLSTVTESDTSPGLYAGYQFNDVFGVEAGYTNIGDFKIHVTMPDGRGIAEDYKVDALTLAGTVSKQLGSNFSIFGKLGAAFTHVKDTYKFSDNPKLFSFSKRRTNPLLGIGVKYAISPQASLRAEYEHFGEVGSAITSNGEGTARAQDSRFSFGITYHF